MSALLRIDILANNADDTDERAHGTRPGSNSNTHASHVGQNLLAPQHRFKSDLHPHLGNHQDEAEVAVIAF